MGVLQSISSTFLLAAFAPIFFHQKNVIREKLLKTLSYKKAACKMLMNMKPMVNFINILRPAFALIFFCQNYTKKKCNLRKAAQNTSIQKSCSKNVAEIDT